MKPRWHEVTAFFGGTFDPPHLGHLKAIRGLFSSPGVKKVRIIPSPIPPHKSSFASIEQRLKMAELNFAPLLGRDVEIDFTEIERSVRFPQQPTYSYDTLCELRREISELAFVIGTDQLEKLDTWHRFPDILNLCHWIVLLRKPAGSEKADETLRRLASSGLVQSVTDHQWKVQGQVQGNARGNTWIELVPTDAPALSSSLVLETISKTGQPPEDALSQEVQSYLKLHRIYGMK